MAPFLKTKTARILAVLVLLFGIYTLAGFVLAPHLVRSMLIGNIQKSLGVTPTVGEIHINPLRLQMEMRDFSLPAAGGRKLLGFERFIVDVKLASLWRRALVFGDIEIEAPFVNAVVAADGSVNLMQLQPKTPATTPPPPQQVNQPLPRIQIGLFRVSRGLVSYDDESRTPVFSTRLEPIEFDLRDFSTGLEGGLFDFLGTTRNEERVEWHGHLSVQPLESDGQIKLTGLQAKTIWEYIENRVNFAISAGKINVDANYRFAASSAPELHVDLKRFEVVALGVRPKGGDSDWISVPGISVGPASFDLAHREVQVDSVLFQGPQVSAWLAADKSVNLAALVTATGSNPAAAAATRAAPVTAPAPAWHVLVKDFAIQDAKLSVEDRSVLPTAKFALAPLSLDVKDASLDLSKPLQITVAMDINASGHLGVTGSVTPAPLAADLGVQLSKFDLAALQPYVGRMTSMTLVAGRLNADLKLRYGAAKPLLAVTGGIGVEGLHTIDDALHDDFINWQNLDVRNISFQQSPMRLEIGRVNARKLYARAIIEPDSVLNVQRVLTAGSAAPAAQSPAPAAATPAAMVPAATIAPAAAKRGARKAVPPASAAARAPAVFIAIHRIDIGDSAVNFSDLSITPNFSAGIQKLNGYVSGLSSQPDSRATVDLKGEVDTFSPVTIAGQVNLLSPALYSDVAMTFRNIELSIMNPYSGKFAGYNITEGKLTTELHYKLDGRKLDAQHHIKIEQLEFGEKTASKDAITLPLKLAVALLKDRNGVIDLDVPVTGSLDDPQFRIWPIIGKILLNTLEKLIEAPFKLLGSLFSGGPDLQFVNFRPGSSAVDAPASDRLKSIAKALQERPQLKLELPIAVVPALDGPALAAAKLAAQLQAAEKSKPGTMAPPFAQLDGATQLSLLHALYVTNFSSEPKYPDAVASAKSRADADAARRDYLQTQLLSRITISNDELLALGQQRALALQQALLTDTQLDPERVFLVESDKAKVQGDAVQLEMSLR